MPVVRTDGRFVGRSVGHVITKFSGLGWVDLFTHGAPLIFAFLFFLHKLTSIYRQNWSFFYFQRVFTLKLWQNTQFTTVILFCLIFTA